MYTKGEWEVVKDTTYHTETFVLGGDNGVVASTYYHWRGEAECEANAMLEGLKKTGAFIKEAEAYCSPCEACNTGEDCIATEDGWLTFIPGGK